ncbi:MAG TPA: TIGR00730 family Rossman fold protein, partial [Sphingomicrobium sp.]|nr:TIGR00730 family Rossman fold protein [Sphingomicrobium sp.]
KIAERLKAKSCYYEVARELARLASGCACDEEGKKRFVVCSGGGPSIMEAANRGAYEEGRQSIGLNIVLPHEQMPNRYVTPDLSFQFHYFALRKMHFLLRARAVAVFPGGYGTFDEMFELLTLIQTGKVRPLPILLFGRDYWNRVINFEAMVEEGVIAPHDLDLIRWSENAQEAWDYVTRYYDEHPQAPPVPTAPSK